MAKESAKSLKTKQLLVDTLKKLLKQKDFSKITITDIINTAGVNRKTFYYHFFSMEALLTWMFEKEAMDTISGFSEKSDFVPAITFILDYIGDNYEMLHSLTGTIGRDAVHKFLYKNIHPLILSRLNNGGTWHFPELINDDNGQFYKECVAEFYTEAVAGTLQNWLEKPGTNDVSREQIIDFTVKFLASQLREELEEFKPVQPRR